MQLNRVPGVLIAGVFAIYCSVVNFMTPPAQIPAGESSSRASDRSAGYAERVAVRVGQHDPPEILDGVPRDLRRTGGGQTRDGAFRVIGVKVQMDPVLSRRRIGHALERQPRTLPTVHDEKLAGHQRVHLTAGLFGPPPRKRRRVDTVERDVLDPKRCHAGSVFQAGDRNARNAAE